jgi:hypothetical protein
MATEQHGNGGMEHSRPLREGVRALQHDSRELMTAIEQLSASASDALREQMDERPYAVLGAGLAAGYILGGGLSLRVAAILAAAAARAALMQVVARGARGIQGR